MAPIRRDKSFYTRGGEKWKRKTLLWGWSQSKAFTEQTRRKASVTEESMSLLEQTVRSNVTMRIYQDPSVLLSIPFSPI